MNHNTPAVTLSLSPSKHVEGSEYGPFNILPFIQKTCLSFYFPFCDFNAFLSLLGKKPRTKAPRIQRLVTPRVLQHKRRRVALKRQRTQKNKEEASEYAKLLAKRMKVRFKSDMTRKFERHQSFFYANNNKSFFANRRPRRSARNRSPRGAAFLHWGRPHPSQSPARSEINESNKVLFHWKVFLSVSSFSAF